MKLAVLAFALSFIASQTAALPMVIPLSFPLRSRQQPLTLAISISKNGCADFIFCVVLGRRNRSQSTPATRMLLLGAERKGERQGPQLRALPHRRAWQHRRSLWWRRVESATCRFPRASLIFRASPVL